MTLPDGTTAVTRAEIWSPGPLLHTVWVVSPGGEGSPAVVRIDKGRKPRHVPYDPKPRIRNPRDAVTRNPLKTNGHVEKWFRELTAGMYDISGELQL